MSTVGAAAYQALIAAESLGLLAEQFRCAQRVIGVGERLDPPHEPVPYLPDGSDPDLDLGPARPAAGDQPHQRHHQVPALADLVDREAKVLHSAYRSS